MTAHLRIPAGLLILYFAAIRVHAAGQHSASFTVVADVHAGAEVSPVTVVSDTFETTYSANQSSIAAPPASSTKYMLRPGYQPTTPENYGPPTDADRDGMWDIWEKRCFNTLDRDGTGDYDEDGISDRDEYNDGTDPTKKGPNWWHAWAVIDSSAPVTNDFAAATQGQVKWLVHQAYTAMTNKYGGTTTAISNRVGALTSTNNYQASNLGQLSVCVKITSPSVRCNGVIPLRVGGVGLEMDLLHLRLGDLDAALIFSAV